MSDIIETTRELDVLRISGAISQDLFSKAKTMLNKGDQVIYFFSARRPTRTRPSEFKVEKVMAEKC